MTLAQDDVYCADHAGNAPRDLYEEPPDFEHAHAEHHVPDIERQGELSGRNERAEPRRVLIPFAQGNRGSDDGTGGAGSRQHIEGHRRHRSGAEQGNHCLAFETGSL